MPNLIVSRGRKAFQVQIVETPLTREIRPLAGAYRQKWGLPADYPMVAPNYAEKSVDLARQIGLDQLAGPST